MVYASLFRRVSALLLPPRCVACDAPGNARLSNLNRTQLDLCQNCLEVLPINHHACLRCAIPLPGDTPDLLCGHCLRRPPLFQRACCALRYDYPANHLVQQLKYGQALPQARVLAAVFADHLQSHYSHSASHWPSCIVPVPLHVHRYRERGYNQVIEVGRYLARHLRVPLRTDVIVRIRDTPEQAGLSRRERRRNLRGAFAVTANALPKHVAVLDDVITTASTVSEISKVLRKAGVPQIDVWGVARAALR